MSANTAENTDRLRRFWRGLISVFGSIVYPLGYWWCRDVSHLASSDRLERGCVFVLPGIQGKSPMEFAVARGLCDGGVELAIKIFDWTTGFCPLFLFHLRSTRWHRQAVQRLIEQIAQYQNDYPGRPVHLIGHSGGGGISMLAAAQLPDDLQLESIVLLAPAISSRFEVNAAVKNVSRGILNVSSRRDFVLLVIGTSVAGTIDGRHTPSAGAFGFKESDDKLHETPFEFPMVASWHLGGHFGCVNRVFVADWIAPLISSEVN